MVSYKIGTMALSSSKRIFAHIFSITPVPKTVELRLGLRDNFHDIKM